MNEVKLGNKINLSLYLFRICKSRYLEENKDRIMTQDEINDKLDSLKLLYLFANDRNNEEEFKKEENKDYIKLLKRVGTEVNVSGYGYNLDKIADILNVVHQDDFLLDNLYKINGRDLVITNNKVEKNIKKLTLFNIKNGKTYKLSINENNKEVVMKRDFIAYGINMLCMDEVENIDIDNEFLISKIEDCMNKNGGYITDIKTLYLFKNIIRNSFIRKWDSPNMMVSIVLNNGYNFENIELDDYYEYYDEDEEDDGEDC